MVYAALLAYAEVKMRKKLAVEERSLLDEMRALEVRYDAKLSASPSPESHQVVISGPPP